MRSPARPELSGNAVQWNVNREQRSARHKALGRAMSPIDAPTVGELTRNPVVRAALEDAWNDSLPADPLTRHEEGGWFYFDPNTGLVNVRRSASGGRADLDLNDPPIVAGSFLVATFHTHPNPASEGWQTGPSDSDSSSAWELGVPCIIRAEDGVHTTGPESRRGGLTGPPGFPD
jgi:hypothetical protein